MASSIIYTIPKERRKLTTQLAPVFITFSKLMFRSEVANPLPITPPSIAALKEIGIPIIDAIWANILVPTSADIDLLGPMSAYSLATA